MFTRNILFTIIIVTAFFAAAEFLLALAGVQPLILSEDPLVGFADNVPQFTDKTDRNGVRMFVTPENKLKLFNYQEFARDKTDDSYRIFCVGGSTTYGRPYRDKLSFCGWLRAYLKAAEPTRNWEVINAGGISYASYRVARMMTELKDYQPDLFIVYSGQNEFLEQRSYGQLQQLPPWIVNLDARLSETRIYSAMKLAMDRLRTGSADISLKREELKGEVDEILNHTMGPESYVRDESLKQQIIMHYRLNLKRMVSIANSVNAGIVFIKPAVNVRDMSPFKSLHRDDIDLQTLTQWQSLYHEALKLQQAGRLEAALEKYRQAAALDDRYAELHFNIGHILFARAEYGAAETAFRRAVEEDIAPLRILPAMQKIVAEVALSENVPLIDFPALLRQSYLQRYGHSVFGHEYFIDHVHTGFEGYNMLAMALFNLLLDQGIVQAESWDAARVEQVRQSVLAGLDERDEGLSYLNLGAVLQWAGKFHEAHAMLLRALEILGPDDEMHMRLAYSSYSIGSGDETIYHLEQLKKPPAGVNTKIAMIRLEQGKLEEAISLCRSDRKLYPDNYMPELCIGKALMKKGSYTEAQLNFDRALDLAPDVAYVQLSYAEFLLEQRRHEEAMDHVNEALRIKPADYRAHNTLARIMLERGDLQQARQHITEALRLQPDDDDAMNILRKLQSVIKSTDNKSAESHDS